MIIYQYQKSTSRKRWSLFYCNFDFNISTHHNYYTLGHRSLNSGTPCCTWSSLLPLGPHSGSASSSSPLHTRSCKGSPGRQEEASTDSFLPLWRWSWSWRQVGRSRCCSLGKRCRSPCCNLIQWSRRLWLWCWLRCYHTVYLKQSKTVL